MVYTWSLYILVFDPANVYSPHTADQKAFFGLSKPKLNRLSYLLQTAYFIEVKRRQFTTISVGLISL
jgi:hypothetical protein